MSVKEFYDDLAARYHLVYEDWDASIARQGAMLDGMLQEFFPAQRSVYDVAVGIGTQSLGLARRGYAMMCSDLSAASVQRTAREAQVRGLRLPLAVADFRHLPVAAASVPVVLCCDNALPHLASADAILATLQGWYGCVQPGGGCLISMRDYARGHRPAPSRSIRMAIGRGTVVATARASVGSGTALDTKQQSRWPP